MHDNPVVDATGPNPPAVELPQRSNALKRTDPPKRQWYIDEIVVAAFAFLGFGGAVFLPVRFGFTVVPPLWFPSFLRLDWPH